jgi:acyl-CoA reductase-like NAD-dependent aldehyde dehydrogenase
MTSVHDLIADLPVLCGGRLVRPEARIDVINPATGVTLVSVPVCAQDMLADAVDGAGKAGRHWSRDTGGRRAALMEIAAIIERNAPDLANILCLEIGLPLKLAMVEVGAGAAYMKYRAGLPARVDVVSEDAKELVSVVRKPIGVVGAVLPWNAPFLIACEKIATAFGAGNTVIVKPSLHAPVTMLYLGVLLRDAVPVGTLSILPGDDAFGAALVAHPGVGMISFTGSISAGKAIMASAAANLKRLSLELGGNDAAIVLADADVERIASKLVAGAFYRSGQVCAAIKRIYAHDGIFERLSSALAAAIGKIAVGDPLDAKVVMGPISNREQFQRVCALVDAAVADGARVLTGGRALERLGYFYPPTLLTEVARDSAIVAEEQFGPVLPLLSFADVDEVVEAVNATPFGLGNSVWTSDTAQGAEIADKLESGSVWVNRHGIVMPHIPFGGMKHSGIGRTNGAVGADLYSELQTISISRS